MKIEKLKVPHWETTQKVIEKLKNMTAEESKQTFIDVGILTPEGKLSSSYGGGKENV